MNGRVIQGFFVAGRLPPSVAVQAAQAQRPDAVPHRLRHGPPAPAFATRSAPVQARPAVGHGRSGHFQIDPLAVGLVDGGGQPLPQMVSASMEAAFGADFAAVRIHVGPQAGRIGALAFTTGNDLYFAPGQYQPDSVRGQQLIGHELAHVVQQRQGRVRAPGSGVTVVQDRALEAEADRLGTRAAAHRAPVQAKAALAAAGLPLQHKTGLVQRKPTLWDWVKPAIENPGDHRRKKYPPEVARDRRAARQANLGPRADVPRLVDAVRMTGIVREDDRGKLTNLITSLLEGPDRLGEVDPQNQQQVELLAYRIKRGGIAPWRKADRKARRRAPKPETYELAVIGAGSTAAYYLDTLGRAYDHSTTIVIGGENPWKRQRGRGISYINHIARQIAMPSRNITDYGGNDSFVKRGKFADEASDIIERSEASWLAGTVAKIRKVGSGFEIALEGGGPTIKAAKVVFAGGSGDVRKPKEAGEKSVVKSRARIIDMNVFVRDKATKEKGGARRVAIQGNNAVIDAVAAAVRHGWTVIAWTYNVTGKPAWLPGTRYLSPPYDLQKVPRHEYTKRDAIVIEDDPGYPGKLRVRDTTIEGEKKQVIANNLDYFIYSLGSGDLLTKVMDESVLDGQPYLEPLVDRSGLFADPKQRGVPQAFLGWQNKDSTFQVFGLAAENYEVAEGRRMSLDDPRVKALKNWVSGDVLTVGQLTYIRSAIRAANNYVPGSIEHRVDYSHADADQIRVHLAARYPLLPETYASWLISMLRGIRLSVQDRLPHGFTRAQVALIESALRDKMRHLPPTPAAHRLDAVNWQWKLANQLLDATPKAGKEVEDALGRMPEKDR